MSIGRNAPRGRRGVPVRSAVIRGVAVLAGAALALTACGGDESSSTAVPKPTDKVLRLSFLTDPGQPPDPDIYYAGQGLILTTNLYEGLLQYKPGTEKPELAPLLAESWTASPDNTTFTLKLRQGVVFHDGTPFTSAAVKPSFDRRLAVNQGPAYMVADVASVTPKGDYEVEIKLKAPNSTFLDYLAAPYGPRMMSPTGLKEHAGSDNAQTYLRTADLGTGAYTLTKAEVGSKYEMKAFDKYWGDKPYFETVDLPVLQDTSTQQLQFEKGQIYSILHDLPASAVKSYLSKSTIKSYALPTMMSDYLYINPRNGFLKEKAGRNALQSAIDVNAIFQQAYAGRGNVAKQVYPANMMEPQYAVQNVTYDTSKLKTIADGLPADQKSLTIGYDSQSTDNQIVANLISAQLNALGLTTKVQSYPTSQIFGWIGNPEGAPDLLATLGWPDAAPPYTWAYISFSPKGGLNYLGCDPGNGIEDLMDKGVTNNDPAIFDQVAKIALDSGCWMNLIDQRDFMIAHPWLKGVEEAHTVAAPNSLLVKYLSIG